MEMEELRKQEELKKQHEKLHKDWLKEKDWFISLDTKKVCGESSGKVIFRLSELKEEIERFDDFKYKGECELLYKTNKWAEDLSELEI